MPAFLKIVGGITSACAEQTPAQRLISAFGRDHLRVCGADPCADCVRTRHWGSPPRVRSRHASDAVLDGETGITSACAEQTQARPKHHPSRKDHLRVCGADLLFASFRSWPRGSPPRVRSRRAGRGVVRLLSRITSACAEQTLSARSSTTRFWDHLRVCGADQAAAGTDPGMGGSPPRVRSRRERGTPHAVDAGITSACAEQTERGWSCDDGKSRQYGSPPRVRSRPRCRGCRRGLRGITSACAEQTVGVIFVQSVLGDHLRVCGADRSTNDSQDNRTGSPPRVRSRRCSCTSVPRRCGITSACAEQTTPWSNSSTTSTDHLRVCGADLTMPPWLISAPGSPPRVRSRPRHTSRRRILRRDHLRVCGADTGRQGTQTRSGGSPPRVRSRHRTGFDAAAATRITSACAEQTAEVDGDVVDVVDHLRVCGADFGDDGRAVRGRGSPPRVRSRHFEERFAEPGAGITSACAEQTRPATESARRGRDHLRVCGADPSLPIFSERDAGSPPRVRSRLLGVDLGARVAGITSACAEQTGGATELPICPRDHLRVCGADDTTDTPFSKVVGSPPRVRSRRRQQNRHDAGRRITSACAEQTSPRSPSGNPRRDHLRVCGADPLAVGVGHASEGSPPRVRSRPLFQEPQLVVDGITSACAEQTCRSPWAWDCSRDHLRVCGADSFMGACPFRRGGSPPRVRSRLGLQRHQHARRRITSACAEQTSTPTPTSTRHRDHLRVCGADNALGAAGVVTLGSPPRVRSRPQRPDLHIGPRGITSACAEQTRAPCPPPARSWDHLRVCGADTLTVALTVSAPGSPPRVRSRLTQHGAQHAPCRITSACAEQTNQGAPDLLRDTDHLRVCGADVFVRHEW